MDKDTIQIIKNRRHSRILDKLDIWQLISDSYKGGSDYINAGYLFKYPRESSIEYAARKKRAVFFNHTQPLVDMLSGFIFSTKPIREIPSEFDYLQQKTSKKKSLDSYMQSLCIQSLMYSCAVLVDSPAFDPEQIQTAADRDNLNPYAVIYQPWLIRDYALDDDLSIKWIMLDNSYLDNSDPFKPAVKVKQYRLWDKESYTDFIMDGDNIQVNGPFNHGLGEVPIFFVSSRDLDDDYITESSFEDIALLDRALFNTLSYLDEMLAAGSFKSLFFPIQTEKDLPSDVLKNGIGGLTVVPFRSESSNRPFFDGATLGDVDSFIKACDLYIQEIFSKVGLDRDKEKLFTQSGVAKELEFQKCEALLRLMSEQLENAEKEIFRLAGLWEGKAIEVKIEYNRNFNADDMDTQLSRLYEIASFGVKALKDKAINEITQKVFAGMNTRDLNQLLIEVQKEADIVPNNTFKIELNGDTSPDNTAIADRSI